MTIWARWGIVHTNYPASYSLILIQIILIIDNNCEIET
jgi:hypothetical protein